MNRICLVSLFLLLAGCTPGQTAEPTQQSGVLSLDTPTACKTLTKGLCLVSEPGEWLGDGQTTLIEEKPEAVYLEPSTAIRIQIQGWTLIFDPGENKPFSVGRTFSNAKLYPQEKGASMTIENGGKKCDEVEGKFTDDILQSAEEEGLGKNPISAFDIRFTMRCNGQPQVIIGRVKLSW
jgi:hypothetical protein